ncbi:MAG: type II toxin-antitoxin system HicA family toxin [Planctomycetes bacterium]|nr:type II toxin-antitoxin system HicA family toxin [Planctomycetota bacterium]
MSELPVVSGKEAIRAFTKLGYSETRISGSHHILQKPGHRYALSIPVHGNTALKRGTLRGLIRDAGVSVAEFVDALKRKTPRREGAATDESAAPQGPVRDADADHEPNSSDSSGS